MQNTKQYDWAVIGAGPAGIATIGKLIEHGIDPQKIAWVDPQFKVGDFGTKWRNVSSNTKVDLFLKFLNACSAFNYSNCKNDFPLHSLDPEKTCDLHFAAEPLQWVTEQLQQQVNCFTNTAEQLKLYNRHWEITLINGEMLYAKNVVLAIGAEPKTLKHPDKPIIPMETALDTEKLAAACNSEDTIAVYGSSHSAIIILQKLLEHCDVKKVINFYQSPLRYAVHFTDWILFDDTGLKGNTAIWARENIDGHCPEKLVRVLSNANNLERYLPECNKVIAAVGFQKRHLTVSGFDQLHHNDKSGIIAPGLFGIGIAFPEAKTDRFGNLEHRVGLWKFMKYLTRIMPVWLNYPA